MPAVIYIGSLEPPAGHFHEKGFEPMGITNSISRQPAVLVVVVLLACVGVSTWGLVNRFLPKADSLLDTIISRYDEFLPAITIQDGRASIRKPQPYYVAPFHGENHVAVIDTRPGSIKEAFNYLKNARDGVVLTEHSLVVKRPGRIQVISLRNVPNTVLDSRHLRDLKEDYFPVVLKVVIALVALYFLVAKLIQALLFGLIPYFGAQSGPAPPTYGQAFKIATFAMIPPVLMDLLANSAQMRIGTAMAAYFILYLVLIILAVRDLRQTTPQPGPPGFPISP
jgi:hypothetical protein